MSNRLDLSIIGTRLKKWNNQRIDQLLPLQASEIKCLRPSQTGAQDVYNWQPTKSGIYTTKSGYCSAVGSLPRTITQASTEFNWLNDVWRGEFSPKTSGGVKSHSLLRIDELLPLQAFEIKCLRPSQTGTQDVYNWQPTKSGIYTTKSGYCSAVGSLPRTITQASTEFDWLNDVWRGEFSPTTSGGVRVLPLGENLQKRGIQNEIRCPKCQNKETSMHIFFTCPFEVKVWKMILLNRVVVLATEDDFKKVIVY
ncbi:hypothetical protein IGI04_011749 [Brassica rapa subsp. trilocularis]|uniref:Reverse transcriptase zinc-binding domain-containing protein n=1 Tax=Brassica rapa subsp. trilocularis TaxID=1813537 RepID=A0ABQ7N416_BRACM|nr:hypothetical protein IGI04_011749 [Brassica rapa subsp. trilocularis]